MLAVLYFWCCVVFSVDAQNTTNESSFTLDFQYLNGTNITNISETCNKNACMVKCCPLDQVLIYEEINDTVLCDTNSNTPGDWKVDIYEMNIEQNVKKSDKKFEEFTPIYSDQFLDQSVTILTFFSPPDYETYILEDGNLILKQVNYVNPSTLFMKLLPGGFCVEQQVNIAADGKVWRDVAVRLLFEEDVEPSSDAKSTYAAYGMLVSSVFLALVLAVYALLPQLRNLAGMMLMAYVATLTTAFVFRAILVIGTDYNALPKNACLFVGFMFYYATVASFTWLNVMSFDIWWSMRGFRKIQQMPRHGALVKLAWYSLYGWGAPLVPVFFIIIVDHVDLSDLPNFIKPHMMDAYNCFIPEYERLFYMNGPIFITTCINIIFFLMTAYNIWRIKRDVLNHSVGESRRNKKEKNRFGVYLKLSLAMGINWVLEAVSSVYHPDSALWVVPDAFNSLVGVFIFIIFICKRHIIVLLCKRFSTGKAIIDMLQPMDSTRTLTSRLNKDGK